jgi:hypothetical protein
MDGVVNCGRDGGGYWSISETSRFRRAAFGFMRFQISLKTSETAFLGEEVVTP